jgi:hypothetical protein
MLLGTSLVMACTVKPTDSPAPVASAASNEGKKAGAAHSKVVRRREGKRLQSDEHRVAVVVLPGDARVEVDGQAVERRDGLVDLIGKVGDVRRLRVSKGDKVSGDKMVTIVAGGAVPPLVDLNAPLPTDAAPVTIKKSAPVQFGFDE